MYGLNACALMALWGCSESQPERSGGDHHGNSDRVGGYVLNKVTDAIPEQYGGKQ